MQSDSTLQMLPISSLVESPHNPRKRFRGLDDLAESIRNQGIITPLVARPQNGHFEIAAGHRRLRASAIAELALLPVIVRPMTDEQFMEVLTVENLQREDVHPYEEAQGYRELMRLPGYDVTAVAGKIGRSESYVRSRLKLLDLAPEVAEAFLEDRITFAHARLIAPLPADKQPEALTACFETYSGKSQLLAASDLKEWIQDGDGETLSDAPFALDDVALIPAAGSCLVCPKSTCGSGKLFGDDAGDELCYDKACFNGKVEATIARKAKGGLVAISMNWDSKKDPAGALSREEYTRIEIPETKSTPPPLDGEEDEDADEYFDPAEKPCSFMEEAVIAAGHDRGDTAKICRNPKCPVHGDDLEQNKASNTRRNAEADKYRQERAEEDRKLKTEWKRRRDVYERICAKWAPLIDQNLAFLLIAGELNRMYSQADLAQLAKEFGIKEQSDRDAQKAVIYTWAEKASTIYLRAMLIRLLLTPEIERQPYNHRYDLLGEAEERLKEEIDPPAKVTKKTSKKSARKK